MIAEYNTGSASSLNTWFEVWSPNNASAFYVVAQPPQILPMPEFGQNELQTIDVVLTIVEYKGQSAAIQPTEMVAITLSDSAVSVAESASKTVTATTVPAGQTVTWASANTSVATVANGVITGVSAGTTTVTASFTTSAGTATASVAVTVTD